SLLICSNFSVNILSSTLPPARKIPGEDVASTSTPVILSSKPAATCAMSSVARISAASCRRELTCMRCSRATFVALVSLISVGFLSCGGSGGESTSQSAAKNSQSIPNVLVDTGSFGLRLLASSLGTLSGSLPRQTSGSNAVFECGQFVDSVLWGPVVTADVTLSNQTAPSVPIEVVDASSVPVPAACKAIGPSEEDVSSLGANGILGIGFFIADCGNACTTSSTANPGFYYGCAASSCSVISQAVNRQVQNPVALL